MRDRAILVVVLCALPRLLAMAIFPHPSSTYFDTLATGLLRSGTFGFDGVPSTYIEPLYPSLLAGARLITGNRIGLVLVLQIAVASIGGVCLYRMGSRLAGPRAGLFAALCYATYPYLIRQSVALLAVTLCTTLAIAATWRFLTIERTRDAVACGALFGLLLLTRASFFPAWAGAGLWLAWHGRPRLAGVLAITTLLVVSPWLARNIHVDGAAWPSRLGENLYVSTSQYAGIVPAHDVDLLVPLARADVAREVTDANPSPLHVQRAVDAAMLARAIAYIREHPARVAWLKAKNALYLLQPRLLPFFGKSPGAFAAIDNGSVRLFNERRRPWLQDAVHAAAQSALLLLAACGVMRRGVTRADVPLWIVAAAGAAVCIVFFPTTRLLAPVSFVLMFYAGVGLDALSSGAAAARPISAPLVTDSSAATPRRP